MPRRGAEVGAERNYFREPQLNGPGEKLSRKQEAAIRALLTAPTIADAVTAAGVGECTFRPRVRLPEFKTASDSARNELVNQTVARLGMAAGVAVRTLVTVATGPGAKDSDKVVAVKAIRATSL